jgi:zinc transport system substrate-binding protein
MALRRGAGRLLAAVLAGLVATTAAAGGRSDLEVVATIKPIHSLLAQLMEGVGTPTLLIEGAASPHNFALKPSGVRAIHAADVFVRVSASLEPFTGKVVRALPDTVRLVTLADAPGVKLLARRTSGAFEPHTHASGSAVTNGAHEDDAAHDESVAHGREDGHIWLDPDNAKAIVAYLARVLGEAKPDAAGKLRENAERLNARIDALTARLEAEMHPLQDKPFVVFHDAFQYFEKRFGLDAVGAITMSPEIQPSAKRLTELRRKIKSLAAVCVFAEPLFQPNLVAAVTEGTRARSGTLDPQGSMLGAGPELYFELMGNLADGLKACLDQPS